MVHHAVDHQVVHEEDKYKLTYMDKFRTFLKQHWQVILIVLLVLFGLNKCATSCSRGQKIKTLNTEITSKDSLISVYEDSIRYLNYDNKNLGTRLSDEKSHSSSFEGIATGNQKELNQKITNLQQENTRLKGENKKLKQKVDSLENIQH